MFVFADYKLRLATEADRDHCAAWIEADADHRGKVTADFFIKPEKDIEKFVLENKFGEPAFYFRQMRALRLDIQFGPAETAGDREKNREDLRHGFEWLMQMCQEFGIRQLIFKSEDAKLIHFCENRFGFQKSPKELVCGIASSTPEKQQEKSAQPLHQDS